MKQSSRRRPKTWWILSLVFWSSQNDVVEWTVLGLSPTIGRSDRPRPRFVRSCRVSQGRHFFTVLTTTTTPSTVTFARPSTDDDTNEEDHAGHFTSSNKASEEGEHHNNDLLQSRRHVILSTLAMTAATTTTAAAILWPEASQAAFAELDRNTGQLFTPKSEMLSGGSQAARGGIPLSKTATSSMARLEPGQALQSIYETRFIAYLSRFLLNFDPAAHAWWVQQGLSGDAFWEISTPVQRRGGQMNEEDKERLERKARADYTFAQFAESVEVGLADYFVGPFGSYGSVQAAQAGLFAARPVRSSRSEEYSQRSIWDKVLFGTPKSLDDRMASARTAAAAEKSIKLAKQGILNLYTLLKTRYNSLSAKRQLAILFSFISSPRLQPTNEIRSLLGEADNATVTQIELVRPAMLGNGNPSRFRTSSRTGGGYALGSFPQVLVDPPPPLGDDYAAAEARPLMRPTSRILRVRVVDGGEGYTEAPAVTLKQIGFQRLCQVAAILDREGHVESVVVLDPGFGYGGRRATPPKIEIDPPSGKQAPGQTLRRAKAVADLEYEIVGMEIVKGGNGYVMTEPPQVQITPPEDPDWFISIQELPEMRMMPVVEPESIRARVTEMRFPDGNIAFSTSGMPERKPRVDDDLLARLQRDPLEMLPSSVRPELRMDPRGFTHYMIPSIAAIPQVVAVMSPLYRACDPLFGGVGRVPVTKGAKSLTTSEYARLALSGALCTVAVRTVLNPLELIKTKQQLENDSELFEYARKRLQEKAEVVTSMASESMNEHVVRSRGVVDQTRSQLLGIGKASPSLQSELMSPQLINARGSIQASTAVLPAQEVIASEQKAGAEEESSVSKRKVGTIDLMISLVQLRGPLALFQSADITFLASLVFGSLGFGATELFRRSFTSIFFPEAEHGPELVLLLAAALATVVTAAAASPFEVLRVRSMGLVQPKEWTEVLKDFLEENHSTAERRQPLSGNDLSLNQLRPKDLLPLWKGFAPTVSRELPFAVAKFLTFDVLARAMISFLNERAGEGALPVQVGVGPTGLAISALAGAVAGVAGALVSHPADLILTKTSAQQGTRRKRPSTEAQDVNPDQVVVDSLASKVSNRPETWEAVRRLVSQEGGIANLFVGLGARSTFFFLVIGLQFYLYDFVRSNLFKVGSDDLSLVLDVFYAVRAGLLDASSFPVQ